MHCYSMGSPYCYELTSSLGVYLDVLTSAIPWSYVHTSLQDRQQAAFVFLCWQQSECLYDVQPTKSDVSMHHCRSPWQSRSSRLWQWALPVFITALLAAVLALLLLGSPGMIILPGRTSTYASDTSTGSFSSRFRQPIIGVTPVPSRPVVTHADLLSSCSLQTLPSLRSDALVSIVASHVACADNAETCCYNHVLHLVPTRRPSSCIACTS